VKASPLPLSKEEGSDNKTKKLFAEM